MCNVWLQVTEYVGQVLTLGIVLGIALKLSRWERG